MKDKTLIENRTLTGERALFQGNNLIIKNCTFEDGESPLKESADLDISDCTFGWKYPVWYSENVRIKDSKWLYMGRAGVWYTKNISVENCLIEAPKNFRRCEDLRLKEVEFTAAEETLWVCRGVKINKVKAKGNYFAMNCEDVEADGLDLLGDYCFDGARNVTVRNSRLISKDSFWNSKNVTVYDSFISGEYLGWNAENLTFINCTIESLQGLCYIKNLKIVNCKLVNTTLAFEYCSDIEATVCGTVDSVKNPISGKIIADGIGELILEPDKINPSDTEIIIRSQTKKACCCCCGENR